MPVDYQVRVYSTSGVLQAVLAAGSDSFRALTIDHQVNTPSSLTLVMYGLTSNLNLFTLDCLVEVRRRWIEAGLDWYTEFVGFHRTPSRQIETNNTRTFTSYSRGLLDLIRRRTIRYYATTNGDAKGPTPADDIIKAYVTENAGSLATVANGRVTDGVIAGLAVAANTSQAASISTAYAWRNLLDAIKDIGESNKVDVDVVWGGPTSPLTFTFTTYYPQRGTDRRVGVSATPFTFSTTLGNMTNPSYTLSRSEEISSVLVLGPGEGPLRDTTSIVGSHTGDSPWNLCEQNQDASGEDRLIALQNIGNNVLYDKRPAVALAFDVIQTLQSVYGLHYQLGDLVTGAFDDVRANVKIKSVSIDLNNNTETIRLGLEEVPS